MVIAKLIGGLGNQMFQYAAGRRLALQRNTQLKLDIRAFETYKLHRYSLDGFKIAATFATGDDFKKVGRISTSSMAAQLAHKLKINRFGRLVIERSFGFEPEILNLPDGVYLDGYWQSPLYFNDIEGTLRREFSLKEALPDYGGLLEKIRQPNSVSVHVRRGDYVNDALTNQFHGTCSPEYYRRASQVIGERVSRPQFFVFSDDIDWVRDNLTIGASTTFIDKTFGLSNYQELILMSYCQHHIIANSSFSWWGAWLGDSPSKIVVAPKRWLNLPVETKDLFPADWIAI
ncbi:alpha-1,2-fucosyltransferase [Patescibacteria group bacterium]|nr:alpha-1,2-fucosyltransferase [Patescibacteria group bacterium]